MRHQSHNHPAESGSLQTGRPIKVGKILPKQISSDGVLRAELTLRAIAGFKGETSEDGDPDDAPRKVELSVDEARKVPLSITVPVFSLPLVVQFQRLCAAPDPCTE